MLPCRHRIPINRTRQQLNWKPQWEGTLKKWATAFIQQNLWRCDPIHDLNDGLQDAYLIYHRIAERYPRVMDPRHFMALFQRALWNQIHDRARYLRLKRQVLQITSKDVSELYVNRIGECTNAGTISTLLDDAPKELKPILRRLPQKPPRRYEAQLRAFLT